jgi:hypothetical protein
MYNGYTELERLDYSEYLNWQKFDTPQDTPDRGKSQYEKGLAYGREAEFITLSYKGVWGCVKGNSTVTSYEGIGYHSNTKELLRGFIDSGAVIVVYRWYADSPITCKIISGSPTPELRAYLTELGGYLDVIPVQEAK